MPTKTGVSSDRAEELDRLITTAQAVLQARRARHATDPSAAHQALRDADEWALVIEGTALYNYSAGPWGKDQMGQKMHQETQGWLFHYWRQN